MPGYYPKIVHAQQAGPFFASCSNNFKWRPNCAPNRRSSQLFGSLVGILAWLYERVRRIRRDLAERMVNKRVAGLVRADCQDQVAHLGVWGQLPVRNASLGCRLVLPEMTGIDVVQQVRVRLRVSKRVYVSAGLLGGVMGARDG
eukprot:365053-Chlamydomonas_euryale.AAC.2